MNNKKTIIILILVLTIGIVGLTVAYFSNNTTLNNIFETKPYGDVFNEEFVAPTNWLPGDTTNKSVVATNTGEVDQAVRVKLTENWKTANNGTLNGWIHTDGTKSTHETENDIANDERVAIINFDNDSDWTKVGDYYYYNYKLAPNESTSSLIKSVTFNPKTKLDDTCESSTNGNTKTVTCNSSGSDYDNATYKLKIDIETVQYNKYNEAWNLNNAVAISETKQRMLKGLKVNVTDATFETGDKTAMFEFSHPATEQTPALTDYRYIGHMPNNYVKFNCDNDGTNCEIWRIIGVFSVDDGEGNYEQRIKLVIGSAFAETMQWDDREAEGYEEGNGYGKNDWNGAKLNIFLNGDYLTRHGDSSSYGLKELAQSQIEDAKYYLGGRSYDSNTDYGSTNDMYAWERGTETFSYEYYCSLSWNSSNSKCASNYCENNPSDEICNATRSISWIGKIALMYSSDYGYTYSNGVEDECFNNPHMCYYSEGSCPTCGNGNYNYPETGWIHNSNNGFTNWLLPPCLNSSAFVFSVSGSGNDHAYAYDTIWVRPVLYLKSSINITGGEGTEQNPYILSNQ